MSMYFEFEKDIFQTFKHKINKYRQSKKFKKTRVALRNFLEKFVM